MSYRIEEWTSNLGEEERHYFSVNDQTYYFGFNPKIIPIELTEPIRKYLHELQVSPEQDR